MRVDVDDSNPGPSQLLRVALVPETFLGGVELVRDQRCHLVSYQHSQELLTCHNVVFYLSLVKYGRKISARSTGYKIIKGLTLIRTLLVFYL